MAEKSKKEDKKEDTVEMFVGGLVLDPATQAPIVVLKDEKNEFCLPIWIGMAEATSIATILKDITLARPMTHDLMYEAMGKVGMTVQRVIITELKDATYFADLILSHGDNVVILDSRPSDAIAMAIRASAPIFVAKAVLDQAKVAVVHDIGQGDPLKEGEGSVEDMVLKKSQDQKDFNAIDKDKWSEILASLDPDDFKYKM